MPGLVYFVPVPIWVNFFPWFNFYLALFFDIQCSNVQCMIVHGKSEDEVEIKLNHNTLYM